MRDKIKFLSRLANKLYVHENEFTFHASLRALIYRYYTLSSSLLAIDLIFFLYFSVTSLTKKITHFSYHRVPFIKNIIFTRGVNNCISAENMYKKNIWKGFIERKWLHFRFEWNFHTHKLWVRTPLSTWSISTHLN